MDFLRETIRLNLHPGGWDVPVIIAAILTTVTVLIGYTRLTTGRTSTSSLSTSKLPPSIPYWVPVLGHLPQWLYSIDGLLEESRTTFSSGIFTLYLSTETHHIVESPTLIEAIQPSTLPLSESQPRKQLWRNVFGIPKDQIGFYDDLVKALDDSSKAFLNLKTLMKGDASILRRLQGNIPDLVTFNPNAIDLEPWERVSDVKVSEDEKTVEVSLLPLTFLFLSHIATDTFLMESLLSDSDHQDIGPLLLAFTQSYSLLMTGLPRTVPHPTLPGAHITRRQLTGHLDGILDRVEDHELHNDFLAERQKLIEEHKAPRHVRVAELLRLLHSLNMPHVMSFWTLLHIISDADLLEAIRAESAKLIDVKQDAPLMGFTVPPRVKIDSDGLIAGKAPLLQRCWTETARIYSRGQSSYYATEDFVLEGESGVFKGAEKWKISKGEYIDIPHWLANTSESSWENGKQWDQGRHDGDAAERPDVLMQPGVFGIDELTEVTRLTGMAFIIAAVTLFDFEMDKDKGIPDAQFAAGVALPASDVRVRMSKRKIQGSAEKAT